MANFKRRSAIGPIFYSEPRNENWRIRERTAANTTIDVQSNAVDSMFLITSGVTHIIVNGVSLSADTMDTDETFHLKEVNNRQYTLASLTETSSDITITFRGTGKLFQVIAMKKLFGPLPILPTAEDLEDNTSNAQIGIYGEKDVVRLKDAIRRKGIPFNTTARSIEEVRNVRSIENNDFVVSNHTFLDYTDVFSGYFDRTLRIVPTSQYIGNGYDISFTVFER